MATPLADVSALEARLGETLTGTERARAEAALSDASALVRVYGLPWPDPLTAPDVAVSVTLAAAERKVRNPEGYRSEMEGSYQWTLAAATPAGVELTPGEIRMVRMAAGGGYITSVPIESVGGVL